MKGVDIAPIISHFNPKETIMAKRVKDEDETKTVRGAGDNAPET